MNHPLHLRDRNPVLGAVLAGAVVFLGLVLFIPVLRDLFRLDVLHLDDLVMTSAAVILSILWFEILKIVQAGRGLGSARG